MKRLIFLFFLTVFTFLINLSAQTDCGTIIRNYSYSLNDAVFLDDTTIIVIGDNGLIMKSTNLGETWKKINSGSYSYLRKIQFLNSQIGYILGSYDLLLRTDDGGDNWFKIPIINPDYPYSTNLFFQSPDTGFVVGEDGKIFKTIDGGRNWDFQYKGYDDLSSVIFINDSIGFICGRSSTLLKTIDFGNTWENINMDDFGWNLRFMEILFTDENNGFLLGNDGEIIKTSDQGNTWSKISDIATDYATNMYFINKKIGYVIGGWTSSTFYKTTNGGVNWEQVSYSNSGSFSGIALNKSGTKGIVVGDAAGYGSTSESGHVMLLTDNDGANWNTLSYLDGEMYFYDICFVDNSVGYLFGGAYQGGGCGFKTINAGLTWEKLPVYTSRNIRECQFLNNESGFISSDSIYYTENGGVDWETVPGFRGPYMRGDKMFFFNKDTGIYAISGDLHRTTDRGKNWEKVYDGNYWFYDIEFFHDSLGFAVGYNTVVRTTDSGRTWNEIDTFSTSYIHTISILNSDTIFLGGADGLLYYSHNSGLNWHKVETGISIDIVDLYFYNDSIGIAITNNDGGIGEIYYSYDLGLSWTRTRQVHENIYKYADLDGGNGYFVGERGLLMKFDKNNIPTFPSYLIGDTLVKKDSVYTYSLLCNSGESTNWIVEGGDIIEISNDSIMITWADNGNFSIEVYLENYCGLSQTREYKIHVVDSILNSTSISMVDTQNSIKIFPNPTSGIINLSIEREIGNYRLYIYNSLGLKIKDEIINKGSSQLNISELETGVYLIIVDTGQQRFIKKIIKI